MPTSGSRYTSVYCALSQVAVTNSRPPLSNHRLSTGHLRPMLLDYVGRPGAGLPFHTSLVSILFGAVGCILLVAIGGAFSTSSSEAKHGTHIVAPRTGDVWQVGELHTVQWCVSRLSCVSAGMDDAPRLQDPV